MSGRSTTDVTLEEIDYYLDCTRCGERYELKPDDGFMANDFYRAHRDHEDFINICQRTTPMPALNLRDLSDDNNALDALIAKHPDWLIDYSAEAGLTANFVEISIRAWNKLGTFTLTGKARMNEVAGLLSEMETRMLLTITRDSVPPGQWEVQRDFLDTTTMDGKRSRVVTNSEYSAYVEYGKSPGGTPDRKADRKRLFDADSILGQAMSKAAELLKEEVVNGRIFATGQLLDSIAENENQKTSELKVAKLKKELVLSKEERQMLREGKWPTSSDDAVDATRFSSEISKSRSVPVPPPNTIETSRGAISKRITRRTFDGLDAQTKMEFVRARGQVLDALGPGESDFLSWRQAGEILAQNRDSTANERINARAERAADMVRLQKNIEAAEEKARKKKVQEAIALLREQGIAVNASSNASSTPPQQAKTPAFDDSQSKPKRRIRLTK